MKNIFKTLAAIALVAMTASCSKESAVAPAVDGEVVKATFNAQLPGSIVGRATNDGTTATVLHYAVYDAAGKCLMATADVTEGITQKPAATMSGLAGTVHIDLVAQQTYNIVFWAQAPNAPYEFDWANGQVDMNYDRDKAGSNESRDAFVWVEKNLYVSGAINKPVELKRPFAQLNIGLSQGQQADATNAGFTLDQVQVTAKTYNAFSFFAGTQGEATGEIAPIEFAAANKTNATIEAADNTYDWVSFNYLLTNADLIDVTVTFTNENAAKTINLPTFTNVPIERNHRTNIVGDLLTDPANFDVTINPDFDKEDIDHEVILNIEALQAAIDAAPANKTTVIYIAGEFVGDVTVVQKPDTHIIVDGNGVDEVVNAISRANEDEDKGTTFNGTFKIHNNSLYNNGKITIKGINFTTDDPSHNFIMPNEFETGQRYSQNVTVEDCTFTATGDAVNTVVGVQAKACKNLVIKNCTASNVHSLIQAQSCDESVVVEDCTVNGKNGVAFKQVKTAVVEGGTITAAEYGIRYDGNIDNYGITVKDVTVTAKQPVIVRKMTGANNTIAFEGTNTLTTVGAETVLPYQVIVTNGSDDAEYVKPTGTYTLTGADNYNIFPEPFAVASWDEFTAALAAGETDIKLTADIEYASNYQLQKSVTLNLGGYSMTLPMINIHTKTTIKNGTINGKVYARKNSEIVFNNVKFSGAVADNLSTEGHLAIQGGCKSLYAKDCLFSPTSVSGSQTKPLSFEGGSTIMKFENCEFKSSPYKKQVYFNSLSATGSLDFTNCNFNNKTPNIMFAAACPLTNLTMSGTTKLSSVTLETNRAKDAVTAEDLAYLRESLIANNSMSSVRLFYAGGSSEYIR